MLVLQPEKSQFMLPHVLAAHNGATIRHAWAANADQGQDTFGSLLRPSTSPVSHLIQMPGVHKAHVACTQCPHVVRLIRPPLTGHSAQAGRLSGPAHPMDAVSTEGVHQISDTNRHNLSDPAAQGL